MGMTQTPLGFLAVTSVENLLKCMVAYNVEDPVMEYFKDKPRFLHLLQLTTLVPNIKLQHYRDSLIKKALNCLWCTQQTDSEWAWQEAMNQFLTNVLSICASPKGKPYDFRFFILFFSRLNSQINTMLQLSLRCGKS